MNNFPFPPTCKAEPLYTKIQLVYSFAIVSGIPTKCHAKIRGLNVLTKVNDYPWLMHC